MTTNYGERPGLTVEPRTMSAEQEQAARIYTAPNHPTVARLLAELDAERAAHAETLAALEGIVAELDHADAMRLSGEWPPQARNELAVRRIAEAAIAQARGSRGAS